MALWDTEVADGIVTFDEFVDYLKCVSAAIVDDGEFVNMMTNAWRL